MRSNSGALAQSGLSGSLAATSTQSLSFPSSVLSDMSSFYTFIGGFRGLAKQEGVAIDNDVFRLHYRYTVCLLALCSGSYRFPRVFGEEFCDKCGDKFSDSLNFVANLVTHLVLNLVIHHILCQI